MAIELVLEFNKKFDLPDGTENVMTGDDGIYRHKFLEEEVEEFQIAIAHGDRVKAFDALLDLVYVAQGTALFMGISVEQWDAGMAAVHNANMRKRRAESASESKRGSVRDVIKPPHWIGPEESLQHILSAEYKAAVETMKTVEYLTKEEGDWL
jgi:predicted HAD superfamily Cof-like phosphohydrolase